MLGDSAKAYAEKLDWAAAIEIYVEAGAREALVELGSTLVALQQELFAEDPFAQEADNVHSAVYKQPCAPLSG